MSKACGKCEAKMFESESPGMCCLSWEVKILLLEDPAQPCNLLLSDTTQESKYFLENIRKYNLTFRG